MKTNTASIVRRVHQDASTQPNINSMAFALLPVMDAIISILPDPRKTQQRVNSVKMQQAKRHKKALNLLGKEGN